MSRVIKSPLDGTEVINFVGTTIDQNSGSTTVQDIANLAGGGTSPVHSNETIAAPYTGVELPITSGVNVGDTNTAQFNDGTIVNYTFNGTAWVVDFVEEVAPKPTLTTVTGGTGLPNTATFDNGVDAPTVFNYIEGARHDLRLTSPIIERGSDDPTNPKGAQFLHNGHSHLNGFYDSWIGNSNNMIYQIKPVRDASNVVTFTKFGDAQINDVIVGRGIGDNIENTLVGFNSLRNNTTGSLNTSIGRNNMTLLTTGSENTAVGSNSMFKNNGNGNVSVGAWSMYNGTNIENSVAIGRFSQYLATGSNNTGVGYATLYSSTGSNNVSMGFYALASNQSGYGNSGIGVTSLYNNISGYGNAALGMESMYTSTTGYYNTATGFQSMYYNENGSENVASGVSALWSNVSGNNNVAIGRAASRFATNVNFNVSVGWHALRNNNGDDNVAIGASAMRLSENAIRNTAVGKNSLDKSWGSNNTSQGFNSGLSMKYGNQNTFLGSISAYRIGDFMLAPSIIVGRSYEIASVGTTDWTLHGSPDNNIGTVFTATSVGVGDGYILPRNNNDNNTIIGYNSAANVREGSANTVVGANIPLTSFITSNVVIGDGDGNIRYQSDANGANFLNGSVKIGDSTTSPTPGTIRYNAGTDKFQGFTSGSGWVDLH